MTRLGMVCDAMSGIDTGFAEPGAAQKLADELTVRMAQAERMGCRRIILLSGKRDDSISREKQLRNWRAEAKLTLSNRYAS